MERTEFPKSQDFTNNSTFQAEPRGILKKLKDPSITIEEQPREQSPVKNNEKEQVEVGEQIVSPALLDEQDVGEEWHTSDKERDPK